jgi:hypothetical protein
MKLYKVLNEDGTCCHGGSGKWFLPRGNRPGKWMPEVKGHLVLCGNGYHLVTASQLVHWLGPALYEAEGRGDFMTDGEKGVWRQARLLRRVEGWNERTARLFACDCAEHVLHLFEQVYPNDGGPRHAIEIGRLYAEGNASEEALLDARDAARDAEAAAWDAARVARAAAWDAAWKGEAAAWGATWGAEAAAWVARAAARDARDAAWGAWGAWDAARAAWGAWGAWDAARAAWSAARPAGAGGDAEHKWQVGLLAKLLEEGKDEALQGSERGRDVLPRR